MRYTLLFAALLLTTDCVVTDADEDEEEGEHGEI